MTCRPLCNPVCIFGSIIHFLVEKCILFEKKDVSIFVLLFCVMMTSQSDVPILDLFMV